MVSFGSPGSFLIWQTPFKTLCIRKRPENRSFTQSQSKIALSPILKSFINLLIEKKRVQNVGEIAEYYHKLIDEYANVARAQITAATQLDDERGSRKLLRLLRK